ncbi:glutamine-hydrolyzing carbamoyl-phosphate synthase small subunit [Massilia violaceinigra]|uniref:Carbamoyl phosphate synthase small chain n=1 Tax=Massilia violaceinigra TaxID=2045208 RepID=A0ABY4A3I5_9BURK|nr:glutamine-hydrolyzing carbamoyl-phosphate synthase small subunit [Massilia violaceinigra]UOD28957.1 glutamine-hydrolyzing carbamoyl-phosphate synthase small subunit [Massilia violaceinigra]
MKHPLSGSGTRPGAILALADGTLFHGSAVGAPGQTSGEIVFNTAMTGYQEILTDPSYARQIVTLTYPHIGNTGVNTQDCESARVHVAGLVIRDLALLASNFRSSSSLSDYLAAHGVIAIAGIDTRKLTRLLRDGGAQHGAIVSGDDPQPALALARAFDGMAGADLARLVTTEAAYEWDQTVWRAGSGFGRRPRAHLHVAAIDFGIKSNILRMLAERGCRITVLPATTSAAQVLALGGDGVFLSNGPGDPAACDYAIAAARTLIDSGTPVFGICLGHQIMALASGARTVKMKFGHRGANHPVQELASGKVAITSQNHGFAVDAASLPANCRVTHVSLFDGTLQGFERLDKPAFCFQGHPEASPGPHDTAGLFDRFVTMMEDCKHA